MIVPADVVRRQISELCDARGSVAGAAKAAASQTAVWGFTLCCRSLWGFDWFAFKT